MFDLWDILLSKQKVFSEDILSSTVGQKISKKKKIEYNNYVAGVPPLHLPYSLGESLVGWSITDNEVPVYETITFYGHEEFVAPYPDTQSSGTTYYIQYINDDLDVVDNADCTSNIFNRTAFPPGLWWAEGRDNLNMEGVQCFVTSSGSKGMAFRVLKSKLDKYSGNIEVKFKLWLSSLNSEGNPLYVKYQTTQTTTEIVPVEVKGVGEPTSNLIPFPWARPDTYKSQNKTYTRVGRLISVTGTTGSSTSYYGLWRRTDGFVPNMVIGKKYRLNIEILSGRGSASLYIAYIDDSTRTICTINVNTYSDILSASKVFTYTRSDTAIGDDIQISVPTASSPQDLVLKFWLTEYEEDTVNKFEPNNAVDGYEISKSKNDIVPKADWCVSEYIPVKPNTGYALTDSGSTCLVYNKDKKWVETSTKNDDNIIITPASARYMRINSTIANKSTVKIVEIISDIMYSDNGTYKIPVVSRGKNLFDVNSTTQNGYITTNGIDIDTNGAAPNNNISYTDYIEITSDKVTISANKILYNIGFCTYDSNKSLLNRSNNNNIKSLTINTTNVKYIRFWFNDANDRTADNKISINDIKQYNIQLELGSTTTEYEPYKEPITTSIYLSSPLMANERLTSEGKLYRADGTIESVDVPELETLQGNMYIDTDTEIKPSAMSATYKAYRPGNEMSTLAEDESDENTTSFSDTI